MKIKLQQRNGEWKSDKVREHNERAGERGREKSDGKNFSMKHLYCIDCPWKKRQSKRKCAPANPNHTEKWMRKRAKCLLFMQCDTIWWGLCRFRALKTTHSIHNIDENCEHSCLAICPLQYFTWFKSIVLLTLRCDILPLIRLICSFPQRFHFVTFSLVGNVQ